MPANCTDRLQPLDISVNKAAKSFLHSQFEIWYASELSQQISESTSDDIEIVDLSTPGMKCIGGQWLVKMLDHLSNNPRTVVNRFQAAHIPQSIDASKPVFGDNDCDSQDSQDVHVSSGDEDESSDNEYEYGSCDNEYKEEEE